MTLINFFHFHMWHTGQVVLTVYDKDTVRLKEYKFEGDRFDYLDINDDVWLSNDWAVDRVYDGVLEIAVWVR